MKEQELKEAQVIPINQYILCEGEEAKDDLVIAMPDLETVSSPYKVLVVKHVAEDCKNIQVNDVVFIGPMSKSTGTIDVHGVKYLMVKETDVAFILRREKKGENNDTQSN